MSPRTRKRRDVTIEPLADMSTDSAWEEWGQRDPYYGVITDPRFRRAALDVQAKREFFESGGAHVQYVLTTIRRHIDPGFAPRRVLEFGCGVGRLLVPFASIAADVVGLDVSPSMLREARANCDERKLHNVQLLPSDDGLSALTGAFDLIHSCIVFQHIPVIRGRAIFARLLRHLRPGGVAAIHLTYSKIRFASTYGVDPAGCPEPGALQFPISPDEDPEIQMNPYNMNEILYLMQSQGVRQCHAEFSDHGGELGLFMFFTAGTPAK
jgi:SAM-dependent methyltransferase